MAGSRRIQTGQGGALWSGPPAGSTRGIELPPEGTEPVVWEPRVQTPAPQRLSNGLSIPTPVQVPEEGLVPLPLIYRPPQAPAGPVCLVLVLSCICSLRNGMPSTELLCDLRTRAWPLCCALCSQPADSPVSACPGLTCQLAAMSSGVVPGTTPSSSPVLSQDSSQSYRGSKFSTKGSAPVKPGTVSGTPFPHSQPAAAVRCPKVNHFSHWR